MGKLIRWLKIAAECSNDGPAELDTRIVVPLSARERCTSKTAGQQIYIACQICRDTNADANRTDNGMTELLHGAMVGPNTPPIAIAELVKQVEQRWIALLTRFWNFFYLSGRDDALRKPPTVVATRSIDFTQMEPASAVCAILHRHFENYSLWNAGKSRLT